MTQSVDGTNSIFNPWKPPQRVAKKELGRDEFLLLLTKQLQAQNPLEPTKSSEFAAQLAQFSSLEQMTDIRGLMEQQLEANVVLAQSLTNIGLPGLIGKQAKVANNSLSFDGEKDVKFGYELASNAAKATISIKDQNGTVIRTLELSSEQRKSGDKTFEWDGKDSNGDKVLSGNYTFEIAATDSNGKAITSKSYSYGTITAVRFRQEGSMVVINGKEVSISSISDVFQ